MRINDGNVVRVVKNGDKNEGRHGVVVDILNLTQNSVTYYTVMFKDNTKAVYFFSELVRLC